MVNDIKRERKRIKRRFWLLTSDIVSHMIKLQNGQSTTWNVSQTWNGWNETRNHEWISNRILISKWYDLKIWSYISTFFAYALVYLLFYLCIYELFYAHQIPLLHSEIVIQRINIYYLYWWYSFGVRPANSYWYRCLYIQTCILLSVFL